MKRLFIFVMFFWLIFSSSTSVFATVPTENNKFGIHLAQPHLEDLDKAAQLVNSNGDWGYVTLVMQEDDRKKEKWQEIFDRMRRLHLIPIVRLATKPEGASWRRPNKDDAEEWANFLDSLNWVVKDRYIVLFNEPNHGSEWGGQVDSQSFAEVMESFASTLKKRSPDFFIMMAGMDASAPNSGSELEEEQTFLTAAFQILKPETFQSLFDGWASHSYPNPGFAGSPYGSGKGTVRTYQWEKQVLQRLGISKNLPVFITETGWSDLGVSRTTIARYFQQAYEDVWLPDSSVVAVTPFVLDYQANPFLSFSWKLYQSNDYYPQFFTVQSMQKIKGTPSQTEEGLLSFDAPLKLVAQSSYHFVLHITNNGEAIWDKDNGYSLRFDGFRTGEYFFDDIKNIEPQHNQDINVYLKTNNEAGPASAKVVLEHNAETLFETQPWNYEVLPLPDLTFHVSLYPKVISQGDNFTLQILDSKNELVFQRSGIRVQDGAATVNQIQNIALDQSYRIVLLKPYYLPRQEIIRFNPEKNTVQFKEMLPFDANQDGAFELWDVIFLLTHPTLWFLLTP